MNAVTSVTEELIQKALAIIKAGPSGIAKSITSASGFAGYDLQPIAMLLQPVITPWRNAFPRVQNTKGALSSEWRYISALIAAGVTDGTPSAEGAKGNALAYTATPVTAAFAELALSDYVTFSAQDAARGFEDDLKARAVTNLLYALMMVEEQTIGFGRIANFAAVTAPTVVVDAAAGTVAAGTWLVKCRAITGTGDHTRTRGRISAQGTSGVLGGATNTLYCYTDWVEGAIAYEWYVDNGAAGGVWYRQATTGVNCVKLSIPIVTTGLAPYIAAPADNVTNALGMNGLIAQLTAANGAYVNTLATDILTGVGTDFVLNDIDAANKSVWDNSKANPEIIYMNSTQRARATKLFLAANGAPAMFVQAGSTDMAEVTGGYLLAKYVNIATGRIQRVETHPYLPDGTMLALSQTIPFPTGGDMVGIDIETSREYQQIDYALAANRFDFGVLSREVLRLKFPGGAWVIRNIKSNATN